MAAPAALDGTLFVYGAPREGGENGLVAMRSGGRWTANAVVHVSGLTDGLLSMPWAAPLGRAVTELDGWCFVQPLLSSSYLGYGTTSLVEDARELAALLARMRGHGVRRVVFVGHSTGCQDVVMTLRGSEAAREMTVGAVLVGPVSDREAYHLLTEAGLAQAHIALAQKLVREGHGEELMPRETDPAPVTAARFLSFVQPGGDDDMFSSDLPPPELAEKLAPLAGLPTRIVLSTADEYIPPTVDPTAHAARLCDALDGRATHVLLDDNHTIVKADNHARLVACVMDLVQSLPANA